MHLVIIRVHHRRQHGHFKAQGAASVHRGVHFPPVALTSEDILLCRSREVNGHLHVVEGAEMFQRQLVQGIAIGRHAEPDASASQIVDHVGKLWVEPALTGAESHRCHRKMIADRFQVIQSQEIQPIDCPVAMRALQITVISETDANGECHAPIPLSVRALPAAGSGRTGG
jgi:hypothetical protein